MRCLQREACHWGYSDIPDIRKDERTRRVLAPGCIATMPSGTADDDLQVSKALCLVGQALTSNLSPDATKASHCMIGTKKTSGIG